MTMFSRFNTQEFLFQKAGASKRRRAAIVAASLAVSLYGARANDYPGEDFSLRFPAALSSFSTYADAAAKGGSSAASKFGSSINPAAAAWSFPQNYDYGLSVQYSNLAFQAGTHLDFLSEAATFDAQQFGLIRFSFGKVSSNDAVFRDSHLGFTYDLTAGRMDWAKRWGALAAGVGFSYSESTTTVRSPKIVFANAERHLSLARFGLEWQPKAKWLLGAVGEYGYAPTETAFELSGISQSEIARQFVFRTGVSYEWRDNALIHLDYQHGSFWNRAGTLDTDRFSIGGDLPLTRFLFVRAGAVVDVRGDFGWTAGFGFYPRKGVTFDFAYQNDVFPELQREFGHSRTLNASVSVQF